MATTSGLMTVEQYRKLPETGPFYYELRNGELVKVCRPKMRHSRRQRRLRKLMETAYGDRGTWETEVAFRARPEYEMRVADLAYLAGDRWESADDEDNILGAPDIVIEVLSPSNTVAEISEKRALCLENGSREFWTVDDRRREIGVSTSDGLTRTYKSGDTIPLPFADGKFLAVDSASAEG
jgi:Uma2 family endonuclease